MIEAPKPYTGSIRKQIEAEEACEATGCDMEPLKETGWYNGERFVTTRCNVCGRTKTVIEKKNCNNKYIGDLNK